MRMVERNLGVVGWESIRQDQNLLFAMLFMQLRGK